MHTLSFKWFLGGKENRSGRDSVFIRTFQNHSTESVFSETQAHVLESTTLSPRSRQFMLMDVFSTFVFRDNLLRIFSSWWGCEVIFHLSLSLSVSANSQPSGKAHRLPPQVTGLFDGDQKLPRPSQGSVLLHSGAVWALQPHHGRPWQGAHGGEMSSQRRPGSSLVSQARPWAEIRGLLLTHAFLINPGVTQFLLLLFCYSLCCYRFYLDNYYVVLISSKTRKRKVAESPELSAEMQAETPRGLKGRKRTVVILQWLIFKHILLQLCWKSLRVFFHRSRLLLLPFDSSLSNHALIPSWSNPLHVKRPPPPLLCLPFGTVLPCFVLFF